MLLYYLLTSLVDWSIFFYYIDRSYVRQCYCLSLQYRFINLFKNESYWSQSSDNVSNFISFKKDFRFRDSISDPDDAPFNNEAELLLFWYLRQSDNQFEIIVKKCS